MGERKPLAFMSYEHFANEHDKGYLTEFCQALTGEVKLLSGDEFLIFHDIKDIEYGELWKKRIEDTLDSTALLIPIITPGFFKSDNCRDELRRFLDREKRLKRDDLILPIYYVNTPLIEDESLRIKDELAQIIAAHQYVDWRNLRREKLSSKRTRKTISELAKRINKILYNFGSNGTNFESKTFATPLKIESIEDDIVKGPRGSEAYSLKPSQKNLLNSLKEDGCYYEDGHFKLSSGKHSSTYINARLGMMNPDTCREFAKEMAKKLVDIEPEILASSTIGGILLADNIANELKIDCLAGRRTAGKITWNGIEDHARRLTRVVLVDDIFMTGRTLKSSISSLQEKKATIVGIIVAVDRSIDNKVKLADEEYSVISLFTENHLIMYDPNECPDCLAQKPLDSIHDDAEDNIVPVILSNPDKANAIRVGYEKVYKMQNNIGQIELLEKFFDHWLNSLAIGLPMDRIVEESRLMQFIRLLHGDEKDINKKRVISELLMHLFAVSNIKVESRSLGCSIIVGDKEELKGIFRSDIKLETPQNIKCESSEKLEELIPYYDALQETKAVFLFDREGKLFGISQLELSGKPNNKEIDALRQATSDINKAIGLVLRRKRKSISVYLEGELKAVAELSEKKGSWQFDTPIGLKEIISFAPHIDKGLMERTLEISREMVIRGYGGLFVLGLNNSNDLGHEEPKIQIKKEKLQSFDLGAISEIAKLDGAVFVSKNGMVLDASVIINNKNMNESFPIRGGARKAAAYRTSKECPETAVVCISQNGTIDIFVNGESMRVSESISGYSR
ncbi:MAG TPA: diadenylate cyclase [Methanothrix sp.]|jgi:orotate phosphoribosyltransferase|uniref:diadenylate cyclase n=1 Tax=Methanothrix sp. TaxID=90426 RepID=UPI002C15F5CD|nr:diadenylate cyclase [Euryarchaeota archaeon]HON36817.1 diadenylate cyclase [Methanothrix sp.]